ncbi:MAG: AraC family transcriptional regulator [Rhodospirillaceae bacterium]|nr:AraC family transcriptional regulator [Rhodospirillaceae bacterium]
MTERAAASLERSCGASSGDWIRVAPSWPGIERLEAFFSGHAFDPHRHDTYAIGVTVRGVQSFRYRGAAQHSVPGQVFVLHPDEIHDGHAGTTTGFRYRILYVEPRVILDALGEEGTPLPFVRETVSSDGRIASAIMPALADLDRALEELQRDQIVLDLAEALAAADPSRPRRRRSPAHRRAVAAVREFLDANVENTVTSAELEAITGLSRYTVARHFRACLGTSPYRYLVMRRLDRVRTLIAQGARLVDAALACGFADQSHMTRLFKKAYGLSPGRWAAIRNREPAAP